MSNLVNRTTVKWLATFYRKNAQLQLPIHLDAGVQNTLAEIANAKGVDLSVFVNELLKKNIELIQMGQ